MTTWSAEECCPHCGSEDYGPLNEHVSVCITCGYDTEHGAPSDRDAAFEHRTAWTARYHVARSQVWQGSRGGVVTNLHLHLPREPREPSTFEATSGRRATITRRAGAALCGKPSGWYERPPNPDDYEHRCPKCVALAERYGITWPPIPPARSNP